MSRTDTITKLRAFLGRCLREDTTMALEAGHGFIDFLAGRNAGWTDIDLSENVRPAYDARLVRSFSPDRVLAECAAKRDILRADSGTPHEEATLRALASMYTDRPGYGEWDTPPFKRSRRGGTATTLCTVCCNGFEIAYKDRGLGTSALWEAKHRHDAA